MQRFATQLGQITISPIEDSHLTIDTPITGRQLWYRLEHHNGSSLRTLEVNNIQEYSDEPEEHKSTMTFDNLEELSVTVGKQGPAETYRSLKAMLDALGITVTLKKMTIRVEDATAPYNRALLDLFECPTSQSKYKNLEKLTFKTIQTGSQRRPDIRPRFFSLPPGRKKERISYTKDNAIRTWWDGKAGMLCYRIEQGDVSFRRNHLPCGIARIGTRVPTVHHEHTNTPTISTAITHRTKPTRSADHR